MSFGVPQEVSEVDDTTVETARNRFRDTRYVVASQIGDLYAANEKIVF